MPIRRFVSSVAVVALMLAIIALGAACGGGEGSTSEVTWSNGNVELKVGDCFRQIPTNDDSFDAEVVSCSDPHDGECYGGFQRASDPEVEHQNMVEAVASYVGIEPSAAEVETWLSEHHLLLMGHWSQAAGMLDYLAPQEGSGPLTQGYRGMGN